MAGEARLRHRKAGTLRLPWWPSDVTWTMPTRQWSESPRVGRQPLLLADGVGLAEYRLSFVLRAQDGKTDIVADLRLLAEMAASTIPTQLLLADRPVGHYRITDVSVVEVRHDTAGRVTVADVSCTLRQASDASPAKVGPVKAKRHRHGN